MLRNVYQSLDLVGCLNVSVCAFTLLQFWGCQRKFSLQNFISWSHPCIKEAFQD